MRSSGFQRCLAAFTLGTTRRCYSSPARSRSSASTLDVHGKSFETDSTCNLPPHVLALTSRRLHLLKDHPISITRQIIESQFPETSYRRHNTFHPVVSTHENFDSLGFPPDHPGRRPSDTYYINSHTLLRTHTSAHEAQLFAAHDSDGFLISADVYRRDAVDRSHYPAFHQMEGARTWDRRPGLDVAAAVRDDLDRLPPHDAAAVVVDDPTPPFHPERNPLQTAHTPAEAEALGAHLKRSLERVVVEIFTRARAATRAVGRQDAAGDEPLRVRWVEASFPFTSPSWELEVYHGGDWVEVLGCGITTQAIYAQAGRPTQLGWAFGIGLDRIAMLLFQIPDIRLFWSCDDRFLGQFRGVSDDPARLRPFVPFSKHPACPKDVSFWLADHDYHDNDAMETVRHVAGDVVEDVRLVDAFTQPNTGRRSVCYRITYRSLERTLTNVETNKLHHAVCHALVERLGVKIR